MKIGILTQPLYSNYGGVLQAYALQKVLRNLGHEPTTLNYDKKTSLPPRKKVISIIKRIGARLVWGRRISLSLDTIPFPDTNLYIRNFIAENISMTQKFCPPLKFEDIAGFGFGAFIVGSDQTWRPCYSPHLPTFFLDFIPENCPAKKIAYASSFGTGDMEYSESELAVCAPLMRKFDAVSVREKSGAELCKKFFGADAAFVLDPTMLLNASDYETLIEQDRRRGILEGDDLRSFCSSYILDNSPEKERFFARVAEIRHLKTNKISISEKFPPRSLDLDSCMLRPVTEWLETIKNSGFVVTDSFHGTVFAILFKTPFISIANEGRGADRFKSLLSLFGLQERLVHNYDLAEAERIANLQIDWNKIGAALEEMREYSLNFLKENLS